MADKKKNASQSGIAEPKEQSRSVKAVPERDERKGRESKEGKAGRRETKQPSATQVRFRNNRIVRFVRDAYHELRYKVTWPTFEEARNMTIVVIALSAAVAVVLGIADIGLFKLFQLISGK